MPSATEASKRVDEAEASAAATGSAASYGRFGQADVVTLLVLAAIVAGPLIGRLSTAPALQTWCTMFVAIVLQAVPFLVLGVVLAAVVSEFVTEQGSSGCCPAIRSPRCPPPGWPAWRCRVRMCLGADRGQPAAQPRCARGSIHLPARRSGDQSRSAGRDVHGLPAHPAFVVARFLASLLASLVVGWLWALRGSSVPVRLRERHGGHHHDGGQASHDAGPTARWGRLLRFVGEARHEFVHTGGFLVVGAGIAASVNTFLPRDVLMAGRRRRLSTHRIPLR